MATKKKKTTRPRTESKKKPVIKKKRAPSKPAVKKKATAPKKTSASKKKASVRKPPRTAKRPSPKRPVAKKRAAPPTQKAAPNPQALELARAVAQAAHDKKATDVLVLDVGHRSSAVGFDYLVLASGDTDVQLDALKNGVEALLDGRHRRPTGVQTSPDWVCLDLDDVVVHFFTPEKRQVYDLEGFWSDAQRVSVA